MTGSQLAGDRIAALALGAVAYLKKPVDVTQLIGLARRDSAFTLCGRTNRRPSTVSSSWCQGCDGRALTRRESLGVGCDDSWQLDREDAALAWKIANPNLAAVEVTALRLIERPSPSPSDRCRADGRDERALPPARVVALRTHPRCR